MEPRLGINNSSVSDADKADTLAKDGNVCQCCGFKSDRFQEVISLNGENITVCSFCRQVLDLHTCASRRAGYLIYLPEFTQAELNHLLRAIYVARTDTNSKIADKARRAFDALTARRKYADEVLGTDDPKILAEIISSFMQDDDRERLPVKLDGIRVLSLDKKIEVEEGMEFNEFPQMLNFWKSNVDFLKSPCSSWCKEKNKETKEEVKSDSNSTEEVVNG